MTMIELITWMTARQQTLRSCSQYRVHLKMNKDKYHRYTHASSLKFNSSTQFVNCTWTHVFIFHFFCFYRCRGHFNSYYAITITRLGIFFHLVSENRTNLLICVYAASRFFPRRGTMVKDKWNRVSNIRTCVYLCRFCYIIACNMRIECVYKLFADTWNCFIRRSIEKGSSIFQSKFWTWKKNIRIAIVTVRHRIMRLCVTSILFKQFWCEVKFSLLYGYDWIQSLVDHLKWKNSNLKADLDIEISYSLGQKKMPKWKNEAERTRGI